MTLVNEETRALTRQDIQTWSLEVSKHSLVATFPFRDGRSNSGDGSWDPSYLKNKNPALKGLLQQAVNKRTNACLSFRSCFIFMAFS